MLGGNPRETTVKERDQSSAPTIFPHQTGWGPEDTTTIYERLLLVTLAIRVVNHTH